MGGVGVRVVDVAVVDVDVVVVAGDVVGDVVVVGDGVVVVVVVVVEPHEASRPRPGKRRSVAAMFPTRDTVRGRVGVERDIHPANTIAGRTRRKSGFRSSIRDGRGFAVEPSARELIRKPEMNESLKNAR